MSLSTLYVAQKLHCFDATVLTTIAFLQVSVVSGLQKTSINKYTTVLQGHCNHPQYSFYFTERAVYPQMYFYDRKRYFKDFCIRLPDIYWCLYTGRERPRAVLFSSTMLRRNNILYTSLLKNNRIHHINYGGFH